MAHFLSARQALCLALTFIFLPTFIASFVQASALPDNVELSPSYLDDAPHNPDHANEPTDNEAAYDTPDFSLEPRASTGRRIRCRILAGLTRPAFLIAARRFESLNPGSGSLLSTSQLYFIYPLFPQLLDSLNESDRRVRTYYDAEWVLRRFWAGPGVTFNNRIYLRNQDRHLPSHPDFLSQVLLLAHEVTHVGQYSGYDFNLRKFGHAYLYNWCLAGRSYWDNKMEVSARDTEERLRKSLMADENMPFFRFWDRDNRHHSIGLPVELRPRNVEDGMRELNFQRGKMHIRVEDGCYRALVYEGGVWSPWNCRVPS